MSAKSPRCVWPWVAGAVMVAGLTVFMSGQQGVVGNNLHVPILRNGPQGPPEIQGVVDDWSHHHVIFSNPGTEEEAIKNGRYEEWLRVVNDPRYIMQQLKRRSPAQGPAAEYVAKMNELARAQEAAASEEVPEIISTDLVRPIAPVPVRPRKANIQRDWSMSLGTGGKVGAGMYPAKFSFSTTGTPSCANDYVVFNTSLAGTGAQASIVAYNNLYSGSSPGCGTSGVPAVYWQYNTNGGTAVTSPVIYWDGKQIAFVQSTSGVASLVLLKWKSSSSLAQLTTTASPQINGVSTTVNSTDVKSSGGFTSAMVGGTVSGDANLPTGDTIASMVSATEVHLSVAASATSSGGSLTVNEFNATQVVRPASYPSCAAPCMTSLTFSNLANDTNSSPFYDYQHDIIYVGDNSGKLHKFSPVFDGILAEVTTSWPASVGSGTDILTSPVYDSGGSGDVFVGDSGGYAYSYGTSGTQVAISSRLAIGTLGILDAPVIDSANELMYVFVGKDGNTTNITNVGCKSSGNNCSGIFRFSIGTFNGYTNTASTGNCDASSATAWGTTGGPWNCGAEVAFGSAVNSGSVLYDGAFDNAYFTGTGTSGNIWACSPKTGTIPRLSYAPLSLFPSGGAGATYGTTTAVDYLTGTSSPGTAATCSPVTEFLGGSSTTTTLASAITTTTSPTTVSVNSGTGFTNNDYIQIDSEIMQISSGGGTTSLTVTRGQLGTTAATHSNGVAVMQLQDWIYLSVTNDGNQSACSGTGSTGACLYNFNVTSGGGTLTAIAGIASAGGSSGTIVDNSATTTGASEIYYSTLPTGSSTGYAVQTSQSAP